LGGSASIVGGLDTSEQGSGDGLEAREEGRVLSEALRRRTGEIGGGGIEEGGGLRSGEGE
jgi:hypothetical protein